MSKDIQLSKSLSWLLRHGAIREGLQISPEGYIQIAAILNHKSIKGKFNLDDVERVVRNNDKQRFKLRLNSLSNTLEIKANQGHTVEINNTDLKPILQPKYDTIVHGTYLKCWPLIKLHGLSRMKRQHIHLAKGIPGDKAVISGMQQNAQVYVYIALDKALADGLRFFESENGVILTAGNEYGYLEPKYFCKVINVSTGRYSCMFPFATPVLNACNNII